MYIAESDSVKISKNSCAHVMCWWLQLYKNHVILPRQASFLTKSRSSNELLPKSIIQVTKKLFVSTHTTTDHVSLSETVPSYSWTLSLVDSRPLQLIPTSVLILLGQIPYKLSCFNNVKLFDPMKNLSHQPAKHMKLSSPCQST